MNGRVQDPVLGRFLSPDPFVQAPYHSQSLNRYSYVWNNPFSLVPSLVFFGQSDTGLTYDFCDVFATKDFPENIRLNGTLNDFIDHIILNGYYVCVADRFRQGIPFDAD